MMWNDAASFRRELDRTRQIVVEHLFEAHRTTSLSDEFPVIAPAVAADPRPFVANAVRSLAACSQQSHSDCKNGVTTAEDQRVTTLRTHFGVDPTICLVPNISSGRDPVSFC
jgi:hypothetical protein